MNQPIIAPSILAANWSNFERELQMVSAAGADWIHFDIMDGHFVPPITFGPQLVAIAKNLKVKVRDVHLMVEAPERQIQAFADAGATSLTVHVETCPHLNRIVELIHSFGIKAGVALNPATPVSFLEEIIPSIDLVLIMTVNPGWGGQSFIKGSERKIEAAARLIQKSGRQIQLEVDGGINESTASLVINAGANVLVAGTYIFNHRDYAVAIKTLRTGKLDSK